MGVPNKDEARGVVERATGSVKAMAQGSELGLPQQQPAAKQPSRPIECPIATAGASTSAAISPGSFALRAYQTATASAASSPP